MVLHKSRSPFVTKVFREVCFCNGIRVLNGGQEVVVRRLVGVLYDLG